MPFIEYVPKRFEGSSKRVIDQANAIIAEYSKQGYQLTLRQLYYQFVSRDYLPNTIKSYKRLGSIINDARLAGLIDWDAIEDRTRSLRGIPHLLKPGDAIARAAHSFYMDKWVGQKFRPEVWIEKEALAGVIERICCELDIPFLSCKGYTSQSEMWASAMRLKRLADDHGQTPVILHFGDHDPSGIDMSRDIADRLRIFMGGLELKRLALNMPQIKQYKPPANPAKSTDSRYMDYQRKFGDESWELDALEPTVLAGLVRGAVESLLEKEKFDAIVKQETKHRLLLNKASDKWDEVASGLDGGQGYHGQDQTGQDRKQFIYTRQGD